jgi:hypothetical protein
MTGSREQAVEKEREREREREKGQTATACRGALGWRVTIEREKSQ